MKFVNLVDCDCRGKEFTGFIIKKYNSTCSCSYITMKDMISCQRVVAVDYIGTDQEVRIPLRFGVGATYH